MTLARQLALVVSAVFLVALLGVQAIHMASARTHMQRQLESLAQDAATSIGLSLGALMRGADPALAETVINPAFDRGHYERIEFVAPGGDKLVNKRLPPTEGEYPDWFVELFPLHAPTAESLVSAGWRQMGKVRVTVHPRFAYEQLWATARDTAAYLALIYLAALLALQLFLRGVLRPLAAVEGAAQMISARNFVTLSIRPRARELRRVVEAMNSLSRKVNEVIEEETRRAERLQAAAFRDETTGLLNARGFAARFESEHENQPFDGAFALFELPGIGALNKALGAHRCDELLRAAFAPLQEGAAAARGFAGRLSGSQVALVLPGMRADESRARVEALRLQAQLPIREAGQQAHERLACGIVEAVSVQDLAVLVAEGEEALRRARESADGIAVVHRRTEESSGDLVSIVREALAARRLSVVGQVAYRMSDHRALHTEIMARLRESSGRELPAAEFMPVVAAHGLGEHLDRSVVEAVLAGMRAREGEVSVNLAMRSAERPQFLRWLEQTLRREPALARRLVFEVPEHGVVQNQAAAAELARVLVATGARLAIDHFGVHRDSIALLQRLRPAYIKLAATHTATLAHDPGARFFAESLVRAARQLEIPVLVLNVEDEALFQAIGGIGFAGYQGNLAGRPSPWP